MFGDIEALEDHEEKEIESWNKRNNMNNAYTELRKREITKQAKLRKKGYKAAPKSPSEAAAVEEESSETPVQHISEGIRNLEESKLVDFILRIHPQEKGVTRLHRECIRTSEEITIGHLKKFLGKKLAYEPYYHFQIIITLSGGKPMILDDEITLKEVRREIWDRRSGTVMMLQYRRCDHYS